MSACGDLTVKVMFGTSIIIIINNQTTVTPQTPDWPLHTPVVDEGCFIVEAEFGSGRDSEGQPHGMRAGSVWMDLARRSWGGVVLSKQTDGHGRSSPTLLLQVCFISMSSWTRLNVQNRRFSPLSAGMCNTSTASCPGT